ncbi:MAG: NHL repeat-containing protein [Actinomycetota bacterium]
MRIVTRAALAATFAFAFLSAPASADAPTIDTFAGSIPSGIQGTGVSLSPAGVAADANGNVYIVDAGEGLVWKLAPSGILTRIAGTGLYCMPKVDGSDWTLPESCHADGVPATDRFLATPSGVAVAPDGDVFVSEMRAAVVDRIDVQTGRISAYAGTGVRGFDGDGGPATQAQLMFPQSLATDSKGNLYIADEGNQRIREVTPGGTIDTVAGCGDQHYPDCFSWAQDGSPVDGTPIGVNAVINGNGWGIAVGPDDKLYIADVAQILRLDPETESYSVVAGKAWEYADSPGQGEDGPASDWRFSVVVAMAFGPNGDLYAADGGGSYYQPVSRIDRLVGPVSPASTVKHVAGKGTGHGYSGDGGPAQEARFDFSQPTGTWAGQGIAVAPSGDVYVADAVNNRVRRIDTNGVVTTVAGNGYGAPSNGWGVLNDQSDYYNGFQTGNSAKGGYSGDGRTATTAQLYDPADVAVDRDGNVYVLDVFNNRVRRISPDGTIATVVGTGCVGQGENCYTSQANGPLGDGGPATNAQLKSPTAIALDRTGTQLYITEHYRQRVRQVNLGRAPFTVYPLSSDPITIKPGDIGTVVGPGAASQQTAGPHEMATEIAPSDLEGVAGAKNGDLVFSDAALNVIMEVDAATGLVTTVAGVPGESNCGMTAQDTGNPGAATRLCGPADLTFGPDGNLYFTEAAEWAVGESLTHGWTDYAYASASQVRKIDMSSPLHVTTLLAGQQDPGFSGDGGPGPAATLAFPHGIAVAPDGSVYVADTGNNRIRRIAPNGTISTIAGNGQWKDFYDVDGCNLAGDGGAANAAQLCAPLGMAFGPDGTLYIADSMNNRIRTITGLA